MLEHLHDLYAFYGDLTGMRVARKHISWYTKGLAGSAQFRHNMNTLQTIELQLSAINEFFVELKTKNDRLIYVDENEIVHQSKNANKSREAMAA
jgi:tRNA-dihydrouridine synthase B